MPNAVPADLLTSLLRDVSRSFYRTLRVLPAPVRTPIGLAYLLARATDTIADTDAVPVDERLAALADLRERILGRLSTPLDFSRFDPTPPPAAGAGSSAAERLLLRRINAALTVLAAADPADRERIRAVLDTITSGQELDLRRFGGAAGAGPDGAAVVQSLATPAELDDYTYRVAGCVGEFWTRMCRARLFPDAALDDARLLADGVRFGQGLQLVNILRDLPRDLRAGRCYLPAEQLSALGLRPADLLDPANEARFRPLYEEWLDRASSHLAAGWRYTTALPSGQRRLRLACAWPVLIGVKTLRRLRVAPVLDVRLRVKITRAEFRGILVSTVLRLPFRRSWEGLFAAAEKG